MSNQSSSSSIDIFGLLGIAFVILKLCKVIDWSWWYVTMPFWGGIALIIILFVLYLIYQILKQTKSPKKQVLKKSSFQIRLEEMAEKNKQSKTNENIR